jgi:hypothetical protein
LQLVPLQARRVVVVLVGGVVRSRAIVNLAVGWLVVEVQLYAIHMDVMPHRQRRGLAVRLTQLMT